MFSLIRECTLSMLRLSDVVKVALGLMGLLLRIALLVTYVRAVCADAIRDGTLASIRWVAEHHATPQDSVYRLLDWCCGHPKSKTAANVLRHLWRIVNDRPAYMAIAAVISSDVSSRERHRSVERLIEELHDDATADIDAADRMEIFALLL